MEATLRRKRFKRCKHCGRNERLCDCVMDKLVENRKGQRNVFAVERQRKEMEEELADFARILGVDPPEPGIPHATILGWLEHCTIARKTKEDWSSFDSLHRSFVGWSQHECRLDTFIEAVRRQGALLVSRNGVRGLLTKDAYEGWMKFRKADLRERRMA